MKARAFSIRMALLLMAICLLITGLPICACADGSDGAGVILLGSTSGEKKRILLSPTKRRQYPVSHIFCEMLLELENSR